jgi:DNA topoisomerase-2
MVKKTVEEIYQSQELHESILKRPDTHVGSIREREDMRWVVDNDEFVLKMITYTPGLYKIFDEIIVNSYDEVVRGQCTEIRVDIDQKKGKIAVWNNGPGIPVQVHKKEGIYVPEMIFGKLLTSSNYDEKEKKLTGGKNGYGAKLANIFSKKFIVETLDTESKQNYYQEFRKNMYEKDEPTITKVKGKNPKGYVCITFFPDYKRFGMDSMSDDMYQLFTKRVYDLAMCCGSKVKVYCHGELVACNSLKKYVDAYYPDDSMVKVIDEKQDRWKIAAVFSPNGDVAGQVAFTNGICNHIGGTHVDDVFNKLIDGIRKKMSKKSKTNIRPALIKDSIMLFVNAQIENPDFDSQTKENMTSRVGDFGSRCTVSDQFITKLVNSGLGESILARLKSSESSVLSKTDGKKVGRITGLPKLADAAKAGGKDSYKCSLILTEGDSARTFALSGFQVVGREYYGAFPLRGKLLNVQEATVKQLQENAEIIAIKKIMGLQENKDYSKLDDIKKLRYGRIIILTDQDVDGFHIKGLILNFFYTKWPSLKKHKDFIQCLPTPIVKASRGKDVEAFYYLTQFEEWLKSNNQGKGWKVKYYKGLGTSTASEAKECFKKMDEEMRTIYWNADQFEKEDNEEEDDEEELTEQQTMSVVATGNISYIPKKKIKCDDALDLAFNKKRADDRKLWLMNYNPSLPPLEDNEVTVYDFITKELVHFSSADNVRSIMSMVDGLKPSQRKALYTMFKRGITYDKDEVKVTVLQGKVTDDTDYHHGEQSMYGTIIGMAQQFPGSYNNINLLQPDGQFGSRLSGGKDAASPRYVFTRLTKLTPHLFKKADDPILKAQYSDGQKIEPEYFVPIAPVVLFNGGSGIGTGFSTEVPTYNPRDVIENCIRVADGKKPKEMIPWFRFYKGTVVKEDKGYVCNGVFEVDTNAGKVTITELPIKVWTDKYKEYLDTLESPPEVKKKAPAKGKKAKDTKPDPIIQYYTERCDDVNVHIEVYFKPDKLKKLVKEKKLEKLLKLNTAIHITNMHLFNEENMIVKYASAEGILRAFAEVRLHTYAQRIAYLLEKTENEMKMNEWKMKFIEAVIEKEIIVFRKKKDEIMTKLEKKGYPKLSSNPKENPNYKYLTDIPIFHFTEEEIEKLAKEIDEQKKYITYLKKITPAEMWKDELGVFMEHYEEWEKEESERYWDVGHREKMKSKSGGKKSSKKMTK